MDRVVVRWDLPQRDMYIAVLKGTPSAKPTATAITRTRTTEIWELALADIYVGKGRNKDTDAEHHRPAVLIAQSAAL